MRTLWIKVGKVFTRTVIVRELASPKCEPNSLHLAPIKAQAAKGEQVNIPAQLSGLKR
jgi:hypothetical protein